VRRLAQAVLVSVVASLVVAIPATAGSAAAAPLALSSKKAFSGNLCRLPTLAELGSAHISSGCANKIARHTSKGPLGTVTTEQFAASWGRPPFGGLGHWLLIIARRVTGSGPALAAARAKLRLKIIGHGAPVAVGSVASELGETSSCANPPKDDCTSATLLALVKNYFLQVSLADYPPTGEGVEDPPEDEPQDLAQEESDKGPITAIAATVASKL
jgi:hypothetical protein